MLDVRQSPPRGLQGHEILVAWEIVQGSRGDPGLTLLRLGFPDRTRDELLSLPLGRRDALLLDLRDATFGAEMRCHAECPACKARCEATFDSRMLRIEPSGAETAEVEQDGYMVCARPPTAGDLARVARIDDPEGARRALLGLCVTGAWRDGQPTSAAELPSGVIEALGRRLSEIDPGAEIEVVLSCAACSASWPTLLDVARFFWTEVRSYARRLVHEVHALAWAYGWSEDAILAMTPARRQMYLEVLGE